MTTRWIHNTTEQGWETRAGNTYCLYNVVELE